MSYDFSKSRPEYIHSFILPPPPPPPFTDTHPLFTIACDCIVTKVKSEVIYDYYYY